MADEVNNVFVINFNWTVPPATGTVTDLGNEQIVSSNDGEK